MRVPTEITSERLILRIPRRGDGKLINEAVLETFDQLHQWMPWATKAPTIEESEQVQANFASDFHEKKSFNMLLFDKSSGMLLGSCGIPRLDWSVPKFEIGYWIRKSAAGRGFTTEAVLRVTDFAYECLKAKRTEIICDARNERSCRVAESATRSAC